MNNLKLSNEMFESIKHVNENGGEFWYARESMEVLKYSKWQNFEIVVNKAIITCKNSNIDINYHFTDASKMIE